MHNCCVCSGSMIDSPDDNSIIDRVFDTQRVYSYDQESHKLTIGRVGGITFIEIDKIIEIDTPMYHVRVGFDQIVMTKNGWVEAKELTTLDEILVYGNRLEYHEVNKISLKHGRFRGYNLNVPVYETYIANSFVIRSHKEV